VADRISLSQEGLNALVNRAATVLGRYLRKRAIVAGTDIQPVGVDHNGFDVSTASPVGHRNQLRHDPEQQHDNYRKLLD
jgi:hypothetical protein